LLEAASSSVRVGWEDDEDLEWDTQIVYLAHHTHERLEQSETTCERLQVLAMRAGAHTVANARSSRILTGIGLCHRRAGRYTEAIRSYESAVAILSRLERATSLATVNGALAVCYRDLAEIEKQRKHALQAIPRNVPQDFQQINAVFCAFEACYLLGEVSAARGFAEQLEACQAMALHEHARQLLYLCRADVAWIEGHRKASLELAKAGILVAEAESLSRNNVSSVARWMVLLRENGEWDETLAGVVESVRQQEAVCWWEEAERLVALVKLGRSGVLKRRYEEELSFAYQRVPNSISYYLNRYGL